MIHTDRCRTWILVVAAAFALPAVSAAQTLTGQARAVKSSTPLGTTVLADTGTLGDASDARDAVMAFGQIDSLLNAEVLHAVTIGGTDRAASQVSLANVGLTLGLTSVTADMVVASVTSELGTTAKATSLIGNLAINGVPVEVSGDPNQTIAIPGGQLIVNEQSVSETATTVSALHVKVFGAADVIIASATAGVR